MTYEPDNYNLSNLDQLNHAKPPYLAAYGLIEAPFSQQHDDRFFYCSSELTERLELLKHYTQYGNLLIIITGENGIGKSSLKQRFINTAQEEWQICEIQAHTMMDASLLLKQIADGFNITEPPNEPLALYEVLSSQLNYMHQASYEPILVIDDAHELPQDALQALLYLAENYSDQETALRIILFCDPEIEIMLDDPAIYSFKERVTHSMEIPALNETQTAEYLRHRLAVAGLDGTSPFTPKLINKIYKASTGIPAKINEYAHKNLLDDSEPVNPDEIYLDDELIQETPVLNLRNILLASFALIIVITVLLFQDKINNLFEEPVPVIAVSETPATEQPASITPPQPAEQKTIEFSVDKGSVIKVKEKLSKKAKIEPPVIKLTAVNPSSVSGSKQRQIISIKGTGFNKGQKIKVSWTGNEKILSETQVNFTSDTYVNLILNVGMQTDTWKVIVIDPVQKIQSNTLSFNVVATEKQKPAPKSVPNKLKTAVKKIQITNSNNGLYGQDWIKQQNKNHFTLQLLGTHQKNTLPSYLKKYALKNDAAIFKTTRNGKDWFTLIYGQYSSKSAAQTAAKQLPKGTAKPWIRTFKSILPSLKVITTTKPSSSNQDGWLWSQDPSHYTLQLTAGTDKKAIQAFIKQHRLYGKAVYFHRLRNGKDWYILVHGSYSDFSQAKQAISQLPLAVQKLNPWTRKFSAIHAELN